MKIEKDRSQPVIDSQDLGETLGLDPADVQVKMYAGEITSRFETGEGEDAGRDRLTCANDGEVICTIRLKQRTP